jgi:hypothetical protein
MLVGSTTSAAVRKNCGPLTLVLRLRPEKKGGAGSLDGNLGAAR